MCLVLALPLGQHFVRHPEKLAPVKTFELFLMLCLRGLGENARRNNRNSPVIIKRDGWIIKHKHEVA